MSIAETFAELRSSGYALALEGGSLVVRGPAPPTEDLRRRIVADRDALKALTLLSAPPAWLATELDLYASGHETRVRRTNPSTGKVERYPVRVSVANVVAAVGAELGIPRQRWPEILPEVEEAASRWKEAGA